MAFDTDNQRLFAASSLFATPLADMLAAPPPIVARVYPFSYNPPPSGTDDAGFEFAVATLPQVHFAATDTPLHFAARETQPIGFVCDARPVHFEVDAAAFHFKAEDQE